MNLIKYSLTTAAAIGLSTPVAAQEAPQDITCEEAVEEIICNEAFRPNGQTLEQCLRINIPNFCGPFSANDGANTPLSPILRREQNKA